ncbi:MAG: hypothetical protein H0T77_08620 [Pyrinomonadaceae bacterium]|nr:hypothetical protein [Pyrinomonadaceae bacterium]
MADCKGAAVALQLATVPDVRAPWSVSDLPHESDIMKGDSLEKGADT